MPKQVEFFNDLKAPHKNSNHSLSSNSVIRSELHNDLKQLDTDSTEGLTYM